MPSGGSPFGRFFRSLRTKADGSFAGKPCFALFCSWVLRSLVRIGERGERERGRGVSAFLAGWLGAACWSVRAWGSVRSSRLPCPCCCSRSCPSGCAPGCGVHFTGLCGVFVFRACSAAGRARSSSHLSSRSVSFPLLFTIIACIHAIINIYPEVFSILLQVSIL